MPEPDLQTEGEGKTFTDKALTCDKWISFQNARTKFHVPTGVVLLYFDNKRKYTEGKRIANKGLVEIPSLSLYGGVGCFTSLAKHGSLVRIQGSVYVVQRLH